MRQLPFTVADLKQEMLFGIPLSVLDDAGNRVVYPDTALERCIRAAVNTMERDLQIDIWKRVVLCRPAVTHPGADLGPDYDIAEDPLDYNAQTYFAYGYFRLRRWPIISVEKIELRFPALQSIFLYPTEWLRIDYKHGQVRVMATAGTTPAAIIGINGGYLPLLTGGFLNNDVPQLIYADYTSGLDFQNEAVKDEFEDLHLALQKLAAANALQALGRGFKPGINSESLSEDGQSESQSFYRGKGGIYGQEIDALMADVQAFIKSFKAFHKGLPLTIL